MVYVDTNSSPSPLEKGLRKKRLLFGRFFFYLMPRVFFFFCCKHASFRESFFFMSDVCVCGILVSLHNNDGDGYDDAEGS